MAGLIYPAIIFLILALVFFILGLKGIANVPFMGIVGFIIGPVVIALAVTGTKMPGDVIHDPESESVQN